MTNNNNNDIDLIIREKKVCIFCRLPVISYSNLCDNSIESRTRRHS